MRYISIDQLQAGMILGNYVFDEDYRVLLSQNKELTQKLIDRLIAIGCHGVYIEDEISEGVVVESVIPPELCSKGMQCVQNGDIDGCLTVAKAMIDEILSKPNISMDMLDLQEYEDYTYIHSVNVATIAGIIAMGMGLKPETIEHAIVAGLLHDLGKLTIPLEILNKPGKLTDEEYALVKNHPQYSYEAIKDRWDIAPEIKVAVLFHHENVNGTGYPRGQNADDMHVLTKILHVADVFDAMVSRRPYKDPYSPKDAAEFMMAQCNIMFDMECVQLLLNYVPMYPKGTEVELSDGRKGIIIENNGIHNLRPVVRLFDLTEIDLSDRSNLGLVIEVPHDKIIRSERDKEIYEGEK